jgi:tetratricopeptide (TPR) repeat protein
LGLFLVEVQLTISQMLTGWPGEAPLVPAQRAVEIAEELGGVEAQVVARITSGNVLWHAGRVAEALRAAEEALELAAGDLELGVAFSGFSVTNLALFMKAGLLMWQGHPREAATCFAQSQEVARARNDLLHPQILCSAGAPFEELTGVPRQALERGREAVELAERTGDVFTAMVAWLYLGWAQLMHGRIAEALESLEHVDQVQRERGFFRHLNLGPGLLAEAHLAAGHAERARAEANRGIAERDTWVHELRAHLSRSRVLRALDGAGARAEIEASLARAWLLLEWSGARAFAPFIVEERARLAAVLGDEAGAADLLRRARVLFADVEATGHAERLTVELGS